MAELTAKKRKSLPKKAFGLPGSKKYPMPDKSHAANAKARATQAVKRGDMSKATKEKIDAKANKVLKEKSAKKNTKGEMKKGSASGKDLTKAMQETFQKASTRARKKKTN